MSYWSPIESRQTTVAWMVVEGVVAIAAGLAAGSLTLMAARARERKRWAARCKGSSGAVASGLRRSGALTCFEFVRDHGIAHASRKAARGAFHLVALAGFLVRDLGAPGASVDLGEIDIIEAHRDSYAGHFMPRAEHMAGWGLDYFKLCHEAP